MYRTWIDKYRSQGHAIPASSSSVVAFVTQNQHLSRSSLNTAISALSWLHAQLGLPDPSRAQAVQDALLHTPAASSSARGKAPPLLLQELELILQSLGDSLSEVRDAALLSTMWFGALRRSEVALLERGNITAHSDRTLITLMGSKTDKGNEGHTIALQATERAVCPHELLGQWLSLCPDTNNPTQRVFRHVTASNQITDKPLHKEYVQTILRRRAAAAGVTQAESLTGHSCRRGFIFSCLEVGVSPELIMLTTRQSPATFATYIADFGLKNESTAGYLLSTSPRPSGHTKPPKAPAS
ncbi:hypothetical protein A3709_19845 [Halioglobus sp. HI00S01]|nr:hypothetical protein A3709_19845 [Halioglobus sp. HI00S01]